MESPFHTQSTTDILPTHYRRPLVKRRCGGGEVLKYFMDIDSRGRVDNSTAAPATASQPGSKRR